MIVTSARSRRSRRRSREPRPRPSPGSGIDTSLSASGGRSTTWDLISVPPRPAPRSASSPTPSLPAEVDPCPLRQPGADLPRESIRVRDRDGDRVRRGQLAAELASDRPHLLLPALEAQEERRPRQQLPVDRPGQALAILLEVPIQGLDAHGPDQLIGDDGAGEDAGDLHPLLGDLHVVTVTV